MKRSEINSLMRETVKFLEKQNFRLPPFAFWSPDDWKKKGKEVDEIKECMLGWDITDFGSGDFSKMGLVIFTIRNGHNTDLRYTGKPYCEKILIAGEGQVTPMHFHWNKVEDIINRCGGDLAIQLYNSTEDHKLADTQITVSVNSIQKTVDGGETFVLSPGESICLPERLYHKFWAEKGKGKVLIGEVSNVNDDNVDNCFYEEIGRFPEIEEDEKPLYLFFSEYPKNR